MASFMISPYFPPIFTVFSLITSFVSSCTISVSVIALLTESSDTALSTEKTPSAALPDAMRAMDRTTAAMSFK